jgi:predicted CXXCH cytochrome family protein
LKKLAFLVVFALAFALMGGAALALETPHGPFDDNTALCAACHRTHTATDDYLLGQQSITGTCIDCHKGGQGADCDVVNGIYVTDGTKPGGVDKAPNHDDWGTAGRTLMGGGFEYVQGASGDTSSKTTSKHFNAGVTGQRELKYDVVLGYAPAPGASTIYGQDAGYMDCVDCHLPHRSTNYRMLRKKPNNAADIVVATNLTFAGNHKYTDDTGRFNLQIPVASVNDGISKWCGACHTYYYSNAVTDNGAAARPAPTPTSFYKLGGTGAATPTYMHAVDADLTYTARNGGNTNDDLSAHLMDTSNVNANKLPVASTDAAYSGNDRITCLTCHRAHGSEVTSGSKTRILGGASTSVTIDATDSTLLRLPKLGVCETCHDMQPGYPQ